jgi:hypothetical protein
MTHIPSSPRRWLRRLLLLLPGTVVVAALLLTGALLILDDADYKRILIWATDTFLDSELEIAGSFSVKLADGIHVSADDIRLQAHDDSYLVSTHEFSTNFRLVSILSGALVIQDLTLTDAHLRINETEPGNTTKAADFSMPPVVMARAHFKNLTLEYQEAQPGTLHSFTLNELVVDDVNDAGPLAIQANGLFEGHEYHVSGALPALADMLERGKPHPVEIKFNSDHIRASLDGQVADFIKGHGLDLQLELHTQDAREILEIFADGVPRVGDLDATARLRGDYDSPGLDDINASFHRDDEVALNVTGTVADIFTGKGLDLSISGHSSRPAVASWLVFGKLDRISAISLDAKLQAQYGRIQLHDVKASASTSEGLELAASGNAELYESGHVFARNDTGITLKFTAPTTAAFNLLDYKGVPELGAVDGTVRLLASRDAIGLYDAEVRIGKSRGQQSVLKGSIGRIGLQEGAAVTGIDLQATLRSPNVAALAKLAGYDLPQLGQGQAELRASGALGKLKLSNVSVRVGDANALLVTAKGNADSLDLTRQSLPDSADFSVTATAARLAEISRILDVDLPDLGHTHATGQMKLRGTKLLFEQVKVNVGAADQPAIRMDGKATTVLRKGSSIDASFDVATTDLLMAFTDLKPGYLGRLEGTFRVSSMDGSWGIQQFRLNSAQTRLYQLDIGGEREDFNRTDLVNVKTSITVRDPSALGNALNMDLSGISPWTTKGVLSTKAETLSYHATGTLGSTTSTTVINGYLKDGKPHFTGKMEIPVLYPKDFGFGAETVQPAGTPVSTRQDKNYIFRREALDVSFLKRFNLDFDLLIDKVESRGELSIDSVNGKIKVLDGKLSVSPLKLVYQSGQVDINFDIDAVGVPAYKLHASGDDIVLGPLMAQVQHDVPVTGYSNIDMDLTARGRSPHDIASSLSGNLSIGLENIKIPSEYINMLSVDVFGWAISKTTKREAYANLNCVVVAFDVTEGKMISRTLIADGPSLTVGGKISLDLGDETMDILLIPKQKKRIFSSIEPVKIRGPIMDPKVEAIPVKAAIQEAGAMVLLPTVVIPVRLLGKLWSMLDDGDKPGQGCASLQSVTEAAEKQVEK